MSRSLQTDGEKSAELSNQIEWPCNQALCDSDKDMGRYGPKRCCSGCGKEHGYVSLTKHRANLELYTGWSEEDGWWSPVGCLIPKHSRGVICNIFACDTCLEFMRETDKQSIFNFLQEVDEYGYKKS